MTRRRKVNRYSALLLMFVPVEKEKPKEEEADVDMGGLFGDEY
jgi:hypothetical protein